MKNWKSIPFVRMVTTALLAFLILFLLIQLVPYGRERTNPPTRIEHPWDSPRTEQLVREACYDCHSNETRWFWYAYVAPSSWLLQRDVTSARAMFNFSETPTNIISDILPVLIDVVSENEMPPYQYQIMHNEARLSTAERKELLVGLQATFGK